MLFAGCDTIINNKVREIVTVPPSSDFTSMDATLRVFVRSTKLRSFLISTGREEHFEIFFIAIGGVETF